MATEDPVLDLSTLIPERPPVRIDGTVYHLRSPEELTLAEGHKFTLWGRKLQKLGQDPDRRAEFEALLRIVADFVLVDASPEVRARLLPHHHLAIIEVFTVLLLGRRLRLAGAIAGASLLTGQRSSRGFNMPSGATPRGGSMAPQPPSSGPI